MQYYDISARGNYNIEKPFLWLAQKLMGDTQLHFIEMAALQPPELHMDPEATRNYEDELIVAAQMPLSAGDDEEDI